VRSQAGRATGGFGGKLGSPRGSCVRRPHSALTAPVTAKPLSGNFRPSGAFSAVATCTLFLPLRREQQALQSRQQLSFSVELYNKQSGNGYALGD